MTIQKSMSILQLSIIVCFLTLETFTASVTKNEEVDLFHGIESFIGKDTFVYACCKKFNEKFVKVCTVQRASNIFDINLKSLKICPAVLETTRRNTVVRPSIKVIPFSNAKTIVLWIERYEGDSTPQEVFVKMTIFNFDNNCTREDSEISIPLETNENPDDFLDKVHLLINDADNYFMLTFYYKNSYENSIFKMDFDSEGNLIKREHIWFSQKNVTIKTIVPLTRGNTKTGFLAFTDFPETYLINESGSKIVKLDIYSEAGSKIVYSTSNDSINLCYYAGSSFSCGRFTINGKVKLKRRFILEWEIVDSAIYYTPKFGLVLITYSNSESCDQNTMKEYLTNISHEGFVNSKESVCRSKVFTVPQWFYNDKKELCSFGYMLIAHDVINAIELSHRLRCIPTAISEGTS